MGKLERYLVFGIGGLILIGLSSWVGMTLRQNQEDRKEIQVCQEENQEMRKRLTRTKAAYRLEQNEAKRLRTKVTELEDTLVAERGRYLRPYFAKLPSYAFARVEFIHDPPCGCPDDFVGRGMETAFGLDCAADPFACRGKLQKEQTALTSSPLPSFLPSAGKRKDEAELFRFGWRLGLLAQLQRGEFSAKRIRQLHYAVTKKKEIFLLVETTEDRGYLVNASSKEVVRSHPVAELPRPREGEVWDLAPISLRVGPAASLITVERQEGNRGCDVRGDRLREEYYWNYETGQVDRVDKAVLKEVDTGGGDCHLKDEVKCSFSPQTFDPFAGHPDVKCLRKKGS